MSVETEVVLRQLLVAEKKLTKRLQLVQTLIKTTSQRFSKERGYIVPLTRDSLIQELNK